MRLWRAPGVGYAAHARTRQGARQVPRAAPLSPSTSAEIRRGASFNSCRRWSLPAPSRRSSSCSGGARLRYLSRLRGAGPTNRPSRLSRRGADRGGGEYADAADFELYSVPALSAFVRSFTRIALAWTLVVAGLMAGAFFVKIGAEFSRVWIATWYVSALLVLFGERLAVAQFVKRWTREGRLNRRAVIVGGGHEAEELIKAARGSHDDRRAHHRHVRRPRRRPRRRDRRRLSQARQSRRAGRFRPRARASTCVIVSLPVTAEKRAARSC